MNQPYETKDWLEASLLFVFRVPFKGIKRNGPTCYFSFEDGRKSQEIIESFWKGDLRGNLREFADAQRRTKDLIHKGYGNGKRRMERL